MAVGEPLGPSVFSVFGWFFILFFVGVVMVVRTSTRDVFKIPGNEIDDFLSSVLFFPTVLFQVNEVLDNGPLMQKGGAGAITTAPDFEIHNRDEYSPFLAQRLDSLDAIQLSMNGRIDDLATTLGRVHIDNPRPADFQHVNGQQRCWPYCFPHRVDAACCIC